MLLRSGILWCSVYLTFHLYLASYVVMIHLDLGMVCNIEVISAFILSILISVDFIILRRIYMYQHEANLWFIYFLSIIVPLLLCFNPLISSLLHVTVISLL